VVELLQQGDFAEGSGRQSLVVLVNFDLLHGDHLKSAFADEEFKLWIGSTYPLKNVVVGSIHHPIRPLSDLLVDFKSEIRLYSCCQPWLLNIQILLAALAFGLLR
jgi:hypothetical protein